MRKPALAALAWTCLAAMGLADVRAGDNHALAGSAWQPVELGGETVPAGPDVPERFIRFKADGKLAGNAGCNRFFGDYAAVGNRLEFGPIGATRMACPRPVMQWEDRFMRAIQIAGRFERQGTELILMDGQGRVVARLRQRDFD